MERLYELENADLPQTESDKNDFTLTAKHDTAIQQVGDSLQQLCDVDWLVQCDANTGHTGVRKKKDKSASSAGGRPVLSLKKSDEQQVDPSRCTFKFQITSPSSLLYTAAHAIVQTVDFNGQRISTGGAKIEATQDVWGRSQTVHVQDNKNGTYTIIDIPIWGGDLHVKINGTPMRGSPFALPR